MFGHKAETYELKSNTNKKWGSKKTKVTDDLPTKDELTDDNTEALPPDEQSTMPTETPETVEKVKKTKKAKKPKTGLPFWRDKKKVGIFLISISLFIMLVIAPLLNYLTTTKMCMVIVAKDNIKQGTMITNEMLAEVSVPKATMLPVFIEEKTLAAGKYAKTDITKDEQISKVKLSDTLPFSNSYLYTLEKGKKAISITINSFATGLSGKLQAGDIISLYVNINEKDNKAEKIVYTAKLLPELMYLRVLSVTDADGYDAFTISKHDTDEKTAKENSLPVTITLQVDDLQACTLAGLEKNGTVHAALVSRGNEEEEKNLLRQQDDFLEQQKMLDEKKAELSDTAVDTVPTEKAVELKDEPVLKAEGVK
ncbi:MAG: Flp pilus assembly protein CpaB [Hydrogenoanaerobacterium sp.]